MVVAGAFILVLPFVLVKLDILDDEGKWSVSGLCEAMKKVGELMESTRSLVSTARSIYGVVSTLAVVPTRRS